MASWCCAEETLPWKKGNRNQTGTARSGLPHGEKADRHLPTGGQTQEPEWKEFLKNSMPAVKTGRLHDWSRPAPPGWSFQRHMMRWSRQAQLNVSAQARCVGRCGPCLLSLLPITRHRAGG